MAYTIESHYAQHRHANCEILVYYHKHMVLNGACTLRSKVAVNFLDKLAGMSNSGILGQGYLCAFQVLTCTQPGSVEQLPVPLKRKRRLSRHKKNKFSNAPALPAMNVALRTSCAWPYRSTALNVLTIQDIL